MTQAASVTADARPCGFAASRPILYSILVTIAAVATFAYLVRTNGVFACQARGYADDRYLAYCGATGYGDYDHGAFWFGREPAAARSAVRAQVLFIGNSRLQFAFSTRATNEWFEANHARYYLLGFAYNEDHLFASELLRKLQPTADIYVINLDGFFGNNLTKPAQTVMQDGAALRRYRAKGEWQQAHHLICGPVPGICGNQLAYFRSRTTGAWIAAGGSMLPKPTSTDPLVDSQQVVQYVDAAREFLNHLPLPRACVILTTVPTVHGRDATASAVAAALGMPLYTPPIEGLQTFDESHLDPRSAERWSSAFLEAAGPAILKCLHRSSEFAGRAPE